jgi:hypothetical protein
VLAALAGAWTTLPASARHHFHDYDVRGGVIMLASTAHSKYITAIAVLLVLSSVILFAGCGRNNTGALSFASHKVKLSRHGITNRFGVEERDQFPTFHYDGYGLDGNRLKVKIRDDRVMINDKEAGMLKSGDSILIGDEGLAVNSLDYGQTQKYLQDNAKQETSQQTSQNIAK